MLYAILHQVYRDQMGSISSPLLRLLLETPTRGTATVSSFDSFLCCDVVVKMSGETILLPLYDVILGRQCFHLFFRGLSTHMASFDDINQRVKGTLKRLLLCLDSKIASLCYLDGAARWLGFHLCFVGDINYKQIRHKFVATENNYLQQFNDKHTPVAGWLVGGSGSSHITHRHHFVGWFVSFCFVLFVGRCWLILILSLHTYSMYSFKWPTTKQHPGSNIRAE